MVENYIISFARLTEELNKLVGNYAKGGISAQDFGLYGLTLGCC